MSSGRDSLLSQSGQAWNNCAQPAWARVDDVAAWQKSIPDLPLRIFYQVDNAAAFVMRQILLDLDQPLHLSPARTLPPIDQSSR